MSTKPITLRITDTTDNKYIGCVISYDKRPLEMRDGFIFHYEKVIKLQDGYRFVSSSYIIDTVEIKQ